MNISDILDSVGAADSSNLAIHAPGAQAHRDLQDLTRAWISERAAPELLTYPTDLMDRTMTRLRAQVSHSLSYSLLEDVNPHRLTH